MITPVTTPDAALLALNNAHAAELSLLDDARFATLISLAFVAARIGPAEAFMLAFDQDAAYDSANFLWFRARHDRFVYLDRIVVAEGARGRGHARHLYAHLFARAAACGHARVVCEVNQTPPNPASDTLHAALGFVPVGTATLQGGAKTVRYLERRLVRAD